MDFKLLRIIFAVTFVPSLYIDTRPGLDILKIVENAGMAICFVLLFAVLELLTQYVSYAFLVIRVLSKSTNKPKNVIPSSYDVPITSSLVISEVPQVLITPPSDSNPPVRPLCDLHNLVQCRRPTRTVRELSPSEQSYNWLKYTPKLPEAESNRSFLSPFRDRHSQSIEVEAPPMPRRKPVFYDPFGNRRASHDPAPPRDPAIARQFVEEFYRRMEASEAMPFHPWTTETELELVQVEPLDPSRTISATVPEEDTMLKTGTTICDGAKNSDQMPDATIPAQSRIPQSNELDLIQLDQLASTPISASQEATCNEDSQVEKVEFITDPLEHGLRRASSNYPYTCEMDVCDVFLQLVAGWKVCDSAEDRVSSSNVRGVFDVLTPTLLLGSPFLGSASSSMVASPSSSELDLPLLDGGIDAAFDIYTIASPELLPSEDTTEVTNPTSASVPDSIVDEVSAHTEVNAEASGGETTAEQQQVAIAQIVETIESSQVETRLSISTNAVQDIAQKAIFFESQTSPSSSSTSVPASGLFSPEFQEYLSVTSGEMSPVMPPDCGALEAAPAQETTALDRGPSIIPDENIEMLESGEEWMPDFNEAEELGIQQTVELSQAETQSSIVSIPSQEGPLPVSFEPLWPQILAPKYEVQETDLAITLLDEDYLMLKSREEDMPAFSELMEVESSDLATPSTPIINDQEMSEESVSIASARVLMEDVELIECMVATSVATSIASTIVPMEDVEAIECMVATSVAIPTREVPHLISISGRPIKPLGRKFKGKGKAVDQSEPSFETTSGLSTIGGASHDMELERDLDVLRINGVVILKDTVESFKQAVLKGRHTYGWGSLDFLHKVVQEAMRQYSIERLVWEMANNDPTADSRDQIWYLRWAVNQWNLGPPINLLTTGLSEEVEKAAAGERKVAPLPKSRLRPVPSNLMSL